MAMATIFHSSQRISLVQSGMSICWILVCPFAFFTMSTFITGNGVKRGMDQNVEYVMVYITWLLFRACAMNPCEKMG